jgi:hypothetical protein
MSNLGRGKCFGHQIRLRRTFLSQMKLIPAMAVFACGLLVHAQTDPCLDRAIPVNVYKRQGAAVSELTTASFRARIRGKTVGITSAAYDNGPRRLVILVDVSGSMISEGRLSCGFEFARDLNLSAPSQESLPLLAFSTRIEDSVCFGQARSSVLAEIDKLQAANWTRLKGVRTEDAEIGRCDLHRDRRRGKCQPSSGETGPEPVGIIPRAALRVSPDPARWFPHPSLRGGDGPAHIGRSNISDGWGIAAICAEPSQALVDPTPSLPSP